MHMFVMKNIANNAMSIMQESHTLLTKLYLMKLHYKAL